MENLTEFLDRIENQAETYQDVGVDSLTENYRWLHIPSRPSEPRFLPSQAGASVSRVFFCIRMSKCVHRITQPKPITDQLSLKELGRLR